MMLTRGDFRNLIGHVRGNGSFPDEPLLAVYDQLRAGLEAMTKERDDLAIRVHTLEEDIRAVCGPELNCLSHMDIGFIEKAVRWYQQQLTQSQARVATLEKALLASCSDQREYLECKSSCDSYGHDNECEVANPGLAFKRLEQRVQELEAALRSVEVILSVGDCGKPTQMVDNVQLPSSIFELPSPPRRSRSRDE